MKDRKEFLYPENSADGQIIPLEVWVPAKKFIEEFKGFKIFRSDPSESPSETVQLSIPHPLISGDMLRINNNPEGYFAATWLSAISLREFFDATEKYFQEFETSFRQSPHGQIGIFTGWREPEFYEFTRPVILDDFQKEGIFLGDDTHELGLIRMDTSVGDVCFEPEKEKTGIIVNLDQGKEQPTAQAVARFVTRTQNLLPEEVVVRTIELLPYKRTR